MIDKLIGRLQQSEGFEWDAGNRDKSFAKHGVTTREAEAVFFNSPRVFLYDKKHSQQEQHFVVLGLSDEERPLTVIFTIRQRRIRIISARPQQRGLERRRFARAKEVA